MGDLAPHRVVLEFPGDSQHRVPAFHLDVDEGVEAGFGMQRNVEVVAVDGHRDGVRASPVDHAGHHAGAAQAPGRARSRFDAL